MGRKTDTQIVARNDDKQNDQITKRKADIYKLIIKYMGKAKVTRLSTVKMYKFTKN